MSSNSDQQTVEREVIRLLYQLLSKWDKVLEYTDEILRSIANKYKNPQMFSVSEEQIRMSSSNQSNNECIQSIQKKSLEKSNEKSNKTSDEKPKRNKSEDKSSKTVDKKTSKKKSNKKKQSFGEELEENFTKLDDIIDYYMDLRTRAFRTVVSLGKSHKSTKDVNREMKDVIEKFNRFND